MDRAELSRKGCEGGAAARLGAERRRWVAYKRSATLLGEYQALVAELAVRALHGHELHAEFPGECASGWQLLPRRVVLVVRVRNLRAVLGSDLLGRWLGRFGTQIHASEGNRT